LCKGNTCTEKEKTVSAITTTLSALYRLLSDSAPFFSLATQQNMFTDHVNISQAFVQGELLPGDGHNGKVYVSSPPGYDEGHSTCITSLSHCTACPLQPELGTPPGVLSWQKKDVPQWDLKRACGPSRLTVLVSSWGPTSTIS